jgi:CRP-like cAMP-binding protein
MVIPHNRFEQVLADAPTLLRSITTELARRLRATDAKLT